MKEDIFNVRNGSLHSCYQVRHFFLIYLSFLRIQLRTTYVQAWELLLRTLDNAISKMNLLPISAYFLWNTVRCF